jgi:O-antigen ligase/Flp pilus assembly protein TadD
MKPNILKGIIYTCLYLILIAPFLVWGKFLFPFITPKTFFFRILIEIALFFYILLIISSPRYRPRFSKLTWAVLIYLLIITFASVFGVDLYRSFWGNIERGEGLLTIYHLFIFFLLISSLFKTKKEWFRFFNISIFVSLLISFYAFGQDLGLDFLLASSGGNRLTATIGNASFLAAYLLLNIFLCLFLLANAKQLGWRVFYGLTFFFEVYILFQTETRGALLGFFGGLLLLGIFGALFSKGRKLRLSFIGLFLLLIILSSAVWFCRDQAWVSNVNALKRLTSISTTDITTQSRILSWQAAWRGWKDRFLFGYGYENYNIAFNKYFPVLIYRDPGSQVWFDRAHNIIFDQAVTGGIFGLMAYLSILVLALWILWSKYRAGRKERNDSGKSCVENYSSIGFFILITLLAAYFVQNFFVFDTLGTYLLFFSILGFLSFLSSSVLRDKEAESQNNNQSKPKYIREPGVFFVVILTLFFVFFLYIFNIKPAIVNTTAVKGLSYSYNNMHRQAIAQFKKALAYGTYQAPEIRHNLVNVVISAYRSGQLTKKENKENFDFAIKEINKNIELSPLNARHYLFATTLYSAGAIFDPARYDEVVRLSKRALVLSPTRPQFYYTMGQARISQGRFKEGIEYFRKGVELNPRVFESHWNLAAAYIISGQEELAEKEFAEMEKMGFNYHSMDNLRRLVRPYLIIRDFHKIVFLYQEMIKLEPNNAGLYARLAASYREIGAIEKAKEAVQKAVELDPSFAQEAETFLKILEE